MTRSTSAILGIICLICLLASGLFQASLAQPSATLSVSPQQIDMGTFYRGVSVDITTDVEVCDGAAIVLEGGNDEIQLNRKGRVAGIWLNVDVVTAIDAPHVYIVASSAPLDSLCPPEIRREYGLGIEYLRNRIKFQSQKPLEGDEFAEFLNLKTSTGAYDTTAVVTLTPGEPGRMKIAATLPISANVPPGEYSISFVSFRDGRVVQTGQSKLTIEGVGLTSLLSRLAHQHAAVYGAVAVLVAMLVGIGMGFLFTSRGGGH